MDDTNKTKKRIGSEVFVAAGMFLVIVAVVLLLAFFLRGQTTVSGENPDVKSTISLNCVSNDYKYDFFPYDNSDNKNLKIDIIFENEKASSASLVYMLYYQNAENITESDAENHASMNINFSKDGLEADALNANFSKLSDGLKMSLYANIEDINDVTSKYFLLDYFDRGYTIKNIQRIYESKGLICKSNHKGGK